MTYQEALEQYRNIEISSVGTMVPVCWEQLDERETGILLDAGYTEGDRVSEADLEKYGEIPAYAIHYSGSEQDEDRLADHLWKLIDDKPYYMVMMVGKTGEVKYHIVHDICDIIERRTPIAIYPQSVTPSGRVLCCREHNQEEDYESVIIALSEEEYRNYKTA